MKVFFLMFSLLGILSCSSNNNQSTNNMQEDSLARNSSFQLSARAQMFIQEWEEDRKKGIEPSESLIEKYNLHQMDDKYVVRGMIKVDENYNPEELQDIGIESGSRAGDIVTVTVPLEAFDKFLSMNGVTYFDISKNVNLKNR